MRPQQIIEVLRRFSFRCALTDSTDYHIEHFLPQSKGGETEVTNVYPLDATLNVKKGKQNPFIFFEREDIRSQLIEGRFEELVLWFAILNDMSIEEFRKYTFEQYEKFEKGNDCVPRNLPYEGKYV